MPRRTPLEIADQLVKTDEELTWWTDQSQERQQHAAITIDISDAIFEASWMIGIAVNKIREAYKSQFQAHATADELQQGLFEIAEN